MTKSTDVVVVIPNLNGGKDVLRALDSLRAQTLTPYIIVVDNASTDGSPNRIRELYPDAELVANKRNRGYAGGVNQGLRLAINLGAKYVAPFNDDAVADGHWLQRLVTYLDEHPSMGAVSGKVMRADKKTLDSTGDYLTVWGLPYPRGRDELDRGQYDTPGEIFAASGAASLFRIETLQQIGLFDEAFFAYYEDVDLGFRMQNRGWRVGYEPSAIVYHKIGMTSGRIRGFTTYQTLKNLPLLLWKNVPFWLLFSMLPRFYLAYWLFFGRAVLRRQALPAVRGVFMSNLWLFWKLPEILLLDARRTVSAKYIWSILHHDLPPNARALRSLRHKWWELRGNKL